MKPFASLQPVKIPMNFPAHVRKLVTFIYPYYLNPRFLEQQVGWWHEYPSHVRQHLNTIIVDDCSPWPAATVLEGLAQPFPIRLFRIHQDVRWNWLAARNIGAHHAADSWILLTDMDHVVPANTAESLIYGQHDPDCVYVFSRKEHTGEKIHPHSASFFMTRHRFWKIGGYDERYSGLYGSDGRYRKRLRANAEVELLTDCLIRHEYQSDSSTVTYQRKLKTDEEGLRRVDASIPPGMPPKVLSFPYEEVLLTVAVA